MTGGNSNNDEIDRLRINSRAKHLILKDYLPVWFKILGTWNKTLNYFDCFTGSGKYIWNKGNEQVEGSPIISINACIELLKSNVPHKPENINLIFIDEDDHQLEKLEKEIHQIDDIPSALKIELIRYDSERVIKDLLKDVYDLAPSFFFIDPYNHPFSLQLMRDIMARRYTEIMVNIMYYRIIMDLRNPQREDLCEHLFYPDDYRLIEQKLTDSRGKFDFHKIINYLYDRLGARYCIPFQVKYGVDEKVTSSRLKYLLIHYSNNFTAFQLMLSIMWKHSDTNNPLVIRGDQSPLFQLKSKSELLDCIKTKYVSSGRMITFDEIMEENWREYFLDKHYRSVLKTLEKDGIIKIRRVDSKSTGLKGRDTIIFS